MTGWAAYESFLPEVAPYVRDCPELTMIAAIRNACIEFCEQSLALRIVLDPITVVVGQAEYDLDIDTGYGLAAVTSANIGLCNIPPLSHEEATHVAGANWRDQTGPVGYITHDNYRTVRLIYVPASAYDDPLSLVVAIRPLRSSTKIDVDILERWSEVIGFGARARLHDMPNQPFSDSDAAKRMRKWFQSGYGRAKIAANNGLGRGPLYVRPPNLV